MRAGEAVGRAQAIALLALLALGTFALGRRLTDDPLVGTAAAWVTIFSGFTWLMAFLPSSFIAATASVVWAVHLALCSHAAPRRRGTWLAAAAGILGGFATGCHLIAFPMLLALLAAVLLPRAEEAEGRPAPASVIPRTRFIVK